MPDCTKPSDQVMVNGAVPVRLTEIATCSLAQTLISNGAAIEAVGAAKIGDWATYPPIWHPAFDVALTMKETVPLAAALKVMLVVPCPEVIVALVRVHVYDV